MSSQVVRKNIVLIYKYVDNMIAKRSR